MFAFILLSYLQRRKKNYYLYHSATYSTYTYLLVYMEYIAYFIVLCLFMHLYVHIFPYSYLLWSPLFFYIRYATCEKEIFYYLGLHFYIIFYIFITLWNWEVNFNHHLKILTPKSIYSLSLSHDVDMCI